MLNACRIRSDYQNFRYSELVSEKTETQFWIKPATLTLCGFLLGVFLHGTTLLAKDNKVALQVEKTQEQTKHLS